MRMFHGVTEIVLAAVSLVLCWMQPTAYGEYDSALESYTKNRPTAQILQPLIVDEDGCGITVFAGVTWQGTRWEHPLLLCSPKNTIYQDAVLLRISGTKHPEKYRDEALRGAIEARAHVAVLGGVPNQPLFSGLKEDALLAHSFEKFRVTGDVSWPVLFPMVASVSEALDVIEIHLKNRAGIKAIRAAVTGASKRGWTTWLSPIADPRIVGIAPAVFDMLNIPAQVAHARRAYGSDSRMIRAYTELGLTDKLSEPRMQTLVSMIDPYKYASKLTLPKLVILGTNDPYWVVDSLLLYRESLPGNTLVAMQPNTGHEALGTVTGISTVIKWFSLLAAQETLPEVHFSLLQTNDTAEIQFQSKTPLNKMQLWSADSDDLDFRLATWSIMRPEVENKLVISRPRYGVRAIMVEGQISTPLGDLRVTSPAFTLAARVRE